MPSVSDKQHNAMEAAAHGHSTLGIPPSVGKDFVNADNHNPGAHLSNAHPHQAHSERHIALDHVEVNPGRKAWNAGSRSITDETPIGQYKHHIHPRRDKDASHFNVPEHPHHRE